MELRAERVSHAYGSLAVLRDIDLTVTEGRIVCLVGPSGCGKSTLLRLLGGLEQPDQGQIVQAGTFPADSLNPLTYVFQDFALLPWRTVEGNIRLVLEDHALTKPATDDIVTNVLERTKLIDFRTALPRQLSGGMKQRVAIARALAVSPSFLLMDEPFGALDEMTRDRLNMQLLDIWRETGTTILFVTHSIPEAVFLGQKVLMLMAHPGRVKATVEIDLPLPREISLRETPEFNQYCSQLRKLLEEC